MNKLVSVTRGDIMLMVCQQHLLSQVDLTWKEGRRERVTEGGREEEREERINRYMQALNGNVIKRSENIEIIYY